MRYLLKKIEKFLFTTFLALQAMLGQAQLIRIAAAFILSVLLAATFLPSSAQTIRRVTTGGTGDGSTWAVAMNLQAALAASTTPGDQVWIAAGTYTPDSADREVSFTIPAGVLVYGGFVGTENTLADRSDGATILSGDLAADDGTRPVRPPATDDQTAYNAARAVYDATRDDNTRFAVVRITGSNVTLDGLTITAGQGMFSQGAGLSAAIGYTGITLIGCTFTGNEGSSGGGAYFGETVMLTGCTFTGNESEGQGGGAFFRLQATLTGCTFTGNESGGQGGGAYFGGIATLTGCTFTGNEGGGSGGGAYFDGIATLTGCTFTGNEGGSSGGGANFGETATLTGCTFTGNESGLQGGGANFTGTATLTGCIFSGNSGGEFTDGGGANFGRTATLTNCVVVGNTASNRGGGLSFGFNARGSTVINSTLYNNTALYEGGGGLYVNRTPFTLRNSILVGNTAEDAAYGHQVDVSNFDTADIVTLQNNLIAGGADPMGADQGVVYRTPGSANITLTNTIDQSDAAVVFASTNAMNANYLRLADGSPAVDAGNNLYLNNGTPDDTEDDIKTDAAGNARIQGGTVDLGAYESNPPPPHTIMLTSHTDGDSIAIAYDEVVAQTIMFSIGGGATGWTSEITGDDFITLDTDMNVAQDTGVAITVRATPTENTGMDERIATITITTMGGGPAASATVTIRQAALPDHVHVGDVVLTTQEQVDTIRNTLGSAVTVIDGYLQIRHSNDITDLSPLGFLTKITGNFEIDQNGMTNGLPNGNSALVDIGDFPFLQKIGGDYYVTQNAKLVNGGNFPVLDSIGGYFFIRANDKLESVGNFPRLKDIGTYFSIRSNDSLRSLYEFPSLINIGAGRPYVPSLGNFINNVSIVVEDNSSLSDCYVLTDLLPGGAHAVSGDIYINNNAGVCTDQNALSNTIYRGDITVTTQAEVDTLRTTLAGKTSIDGNLTIGYTFGISRTNITDLTPLSNVSHITGNLRITKNGFANLNGLNNLQTIGGYFLVQGNGELTDLGDFSVLQSIGGLFYVTNNDTLTTLGNFPALTSIGTGTVPVPSVGGNVDNVSIVVEANSSLSDCYTLTDFFPGGAHAVSGDIYINNNALGCSSGDEIIPAVPHTIMLTSHTDGDSIAIAYDGVTTQTIMFSIGGGATGWTSDITGDDFITLDPFANVADTGVAITVRATPTENTGTDDRIATITITTMGGTGVPASARVTVTQSGIPVYPESITLRNQADVDNIRTTLGRATAIGGSLTIGPSTDINNLDSLYFLTGITGNLEIRNNLMLEDVGDFPVLRSIGGYFRVQDNNQLITVGSFQSLETVGGNLNFDGNPKITMIGAYPRLRSIGDQFRVINCEQLQSLNGFPSLTQVGATFFVFRNDSLKSVESFPVLTTIGGNLQIDQNDVLDSIGDFPVLASVGTDLRIALNPLLESIGDFPSLTTVGGNVPITENPLLRSIGDFSVLTTIGGNLQIDQNNVLRSIGDFSVLTTIEGDLQIQNNDSLSFCCGLSRVLLNESTTVSGNTTISGNALGCNDKEEINCDISFQPLIDTLMLSFQSTTTTFILHSPTRWRLSREEGTAAAWLTGLSLDGGSTSVTDDLMGEGTASITVTYAQNGTSESRTARLRISFLDTMGGGELTSPMPYTLTLIQERATSILELRTPNAVNVGDESGSIELAFRSNIRWRLRKSDPSVDWITMFFVGTTNVMDSLEGGMNGDLTTVNDTTVTIIYDEAPTTSSRSTELVLVAIDDDDNELPISVNITITQSGIPAYTGSVTLRNQADVDNIRTTLGRATAIGGSLTIGSSTDITHLDSLYFLTGITGNLEIRDNSMLEDVGDFPALDSIGGNFFMHNNSILRNAGNFPMLSGMGGYFLIRASDSLTSVGSFPRLATVGGYFSVRGTKILRVLYEFPALTSIGMGSAWVPSQGGFEANASIVVEDNPLLFYCCGLSRFFSGGSNPASGDVYIGSNSTGCNSKKEVSCDISSRLPSDTLMLPFYTTDTTFIFHSPTRWSMSQEGTAADWITGLSLDGGTPVTDSLMGDQTASITVTYAQNGTSESRTARLRISFLDTMGGELTSPMPYTLTLIQEEVMPTLQLPPDTVNVSHFSGSTGITLSANNVKWRLRKDSGADWITMLSVGAISHTDTLIVNNNDFVPTDTVVTITYEELPISLADRSTSLVLEAIDNDGGVLDDLSPITITLTQAIAPYMGDITLTTQQAVNTIRNTLGNPRVTAIVGNLIIGPSSDITHLDSLRFLTEITGNLEISNNSMLEDVGEFPALDSIGGYFLMHSNSILRNAGNFPMLSAIGGYFLIRASDSLTSVGSFPRLTIIGESFSVRGNTILRVLYEFPALTSIGVNDGQGPYVPSQGGFEANASIVVEGNPLLFYCCGLSRFFSGRSNPASGGVYIGSNSTSCNSEEEIGCDISSRLTSDTFMLPFHTTDTTFILHSQTRWRLSREEGTEADWITGLSLDGGSINVPDNLMGYQTASITVTYAQNGTSESRTARLIISFLDESGTVLDSPVPDTLTLIQEEVMPTLQLPPDTVNVSHFSGSTGITLSANNVKWRLRKDSGADWITMLSVGSISHTDTLTATINSFVPTDTVVTITYEELPISLADRSTSLVLEAIDNDGGVLDDLSPITITLTQAIAPYMGDITLTTQQAVDTIRNTLGNPRVTTIVGNLIIGASSDITHLDSLRFLTEITGNFFIGNTNRGNDSLKDIGGFPFLQKIGGDYYVTENTNLVNGGNFPVLDSIGGYFFIRSNAKLENVGTFPRLKDIGTYFSIRSSDSLRSLYEFPALTSIGKGSPYVPSSNSGSGGTLNDVSIVVEDNPLLFYCCGLSRFFSGRSNPASGGVYIGSNSTGCDSEEEISCDIFDQPLTDTLRLPFHTTDTTFILHSQTRWRLSREEGTESNWITGLSLDGGSTNVTNNLMGDQTASITVTYAQNGTAESRTARLRISFLDTIGELTSPMPYTLTLIQEEVMPTLQPFPDTVNVSHLSGNTNIILTANNVKWRLRKDSVADWLTMLSVGATNHTDTLIVTNNSFVPTDTVVTITYEELPISLTNRRALLVLESIDDEGNMLDNVSPIMITFTQMVPSYMGDVVLINQAQVDSIRFTLGNPRITVIDGYLQIGPSNDITNLDSLNFLTEITENFFIGGVNADNSALTNIGDFPNLQKIGGGYSVAGNPELIHGGNFPVLESIGDKFIASGGASGSQNAINVLHGYFFIRSNPKLESLGTFPRLKRIGTFFTARGHDSLRFLYDFPSLISIGTGSPHVPSTSGSVANTSIVVEDNPLLFYCCTLTKFRSGGSNPVSGTIYITNNSTGCSSAGQANCDPFLRLSMDRDTVASSSLETSFILTANTRWRLSKLNSETNWITSFSAENMTERDSLTGGQNDSLLTSTSVTINYNQNFISEDSLTERLLVSLLDEAGEALTSPAPDTFTIVRHMIVRQRNQFYIGDISVSNQAEVDALGVSGGALAGNITKIIGNVVISGSITDLSIFNNIDTITGYLRAEGLTELSALSQDTSGSGDYVGLTNLRMVGGYFIVGRGETSSLIGSANTSLDSVGYFPHLDSIGGFFEIRDNESLDAVGTFPVLRSIGGRFRLRDNNQLLHIPDFDGLVRIGQEITIEVNNKLITVGSFPRLETIGGDFNFTNNPQLTMRGTYPVLRSIGNNFKVDNCDKLQKINNFPSLTTIKGNLEIIRNAVLKSIGDFPVLNSIERKLEIQNNDLLGDCCGLLRLLSGSIITGSTIIQNNAVGCDSESEINTPLTLISSTETTIVYDNTDPITIDFTLGCGVTGWTSTITGDDFITLSSTGGSTTQTGAITIMATPTENTGVERTATITISTTGQLGNAVTEEVTITQKGAELPTLMLTSKNRDTIAYDAMAISDITFTVGGGAIGWKAKVINEDKFLTLVDSVGNAGRGTIRVIATENTGEARIDTIVITTEGSTGDLVTDTITITQEAIPTITDLDKIITINHDVTDAHIITFNVGGSAKGWTASLAPGFVMLDKDRGDSGTGIKVTATPMVNTGSLRTATITISTAGHLGDPITEEVTIMQKGAPPTLTLSRTTASVDATAQMLTVGVTLGGSAEGWDVTVTDNEDFIDTLKVGDDSLKITILENSTTDSREATLTFTTTGGTGEVTQTLVITQAGGVPTLSITETSLAVDSAAGTANIKIMSNTDWRVTTTASFVDSLIFTPTEGSVVASAVPSGGSITLEGTGSGNLSVVYKANTEAAREAVIALTRTGGTDIDIVLMQAAGPPTLTLSRTTASVDATAQTLTVGVTLGGGAASWNVTEISDFITTSKVGDDSLRITILENTTTDSREATLTFTTTGGTGEVTQTLVITQLASDVKLPTLTLSGTGIIEPSGSETSYTADVDSAAQMLTVSVAIIDGTDGWKVMKTSDDQGFVTLSDSTGAAGSNVELMIKENLTTASREATLIFTTTGAAPQTLVITQAGGVPTLSITGEASRDLEFAGGREDIEIMSNTNWRATTAASFVDSLIFTPTGGSAGTPSTSERTIDVAEEVVSRSGTVRSTSSYSLQGNFTITVSGNDLTISFADDFVADTRLPRFVLYLTNNPNSPAGGKLLGDVETFSGAHEIVVDSVGLFDYNYLFYYCAAFRIKIGHGEIIGDGITLNSITLDGTGSGTLRIVYAANTEAKRMADITLTRTGGTDIDITLMQAAGLPTIMLTSGNTVDVPNTETTPLDSIAIMFVVGGGVTGWTAAVDADFVTLGKTMGSSGSATLKAAVTENTGVERTAIITLTTTTDEGTEKAETTIMIKQGGAPPTLEVAIPTPKSGSDTTIAYDATTLNVMFTVGGGATGWEATVIDRDDEANDFLTLVSASGTASTNTIRVTVDENTGGKRMDTVVITTEGGTGDAADTVIVTQEAVPTIMVTNSDEITIDYDITAAQTIEFNVGGSATGWRVTSNHDSLTLSPTSGSSGTGQEVMATFTENRDVLRAATITIITTGQLGEAKTATVMITQAAAPASPELYLISAAINYHSHDDTNSIPINFIVGGGATGWVSTITYTPANANFITLSSTGSTTQTGDITIIASPMENMGGERTATITLSTTGQAAFGFSAATREITITQEAALPDYIYTGNITVTTQTEVDSLRTTLAGKTIIDGNLTIGYTLVRDSLSSSNITNLTPLSNIVHITGGVWIQQNGQLVNFTGLDSLQTIGRFFQVNSNAKLTTLGDFHALDSIGGDFLVFRNGELTTLGDFSALQSIGGKFHVSYNDQLRTLGDFLVLNSIGEDFEVFNNDQLTTLGDFPALDSIGGLFNVDNNPILRSIGDFPELQTIGGYFRVIRSGKLTTLGYFPGLQSIGGYFRVSNNDSLTTLGYFPALDSIGGYFNVNNNDQLTTLGDFPVLQSIGEYFWVYSNSELTDLGDFPELQSIGGFFRVTVNFQLTSLGDFPTLQSIGGYFRVNNNDQLRTLGDFPTLMSIGIGSAFVPSLGEGRDSVSIVVERNSNLVLCSWVENFLPDGIHAVTGGIYINNNATGCETSEEIKNPPPVLVVKNPIFAHKDSTTTSFNIYANVRWQLATSDDATWITSLSSDSSTHTSRTTGENEATITLTHTRAPDETPRRTTLTLTAIDENGNELTNPASITIHFTQLPTVYDGNITLRSQEEVNEFISNTTLIDGNLTIGYTSGSSRSDITDLTPLSNINQITGYVWIRQNGQLDNINALNNLQTIGGYFSMNSNDTLTTIGDFPTLQSIGGYFQISRNDQLTTIGDFTALQTIEEGFYVSNNDQLTTIGDFTALQTIGEYFSVSNNDQLTTLGDFTALQSIGEYFWVNGNDQLTTFGNFPTLQSIGGYFQISRNDQLTTIGDFSVLQTIGEDFYVTDNDSLTTLGNFPNLTSIGTSSTYIPSLDERRDTVSIVVENNPRLSDCSVLTEFLTVGRHAVSGEIYINNNATEGDCNSPGDIIAAAPIIMLTSHTDGDSIAVVYNEVTAQTITFDVGGSATGWIATSDQDFVRLAPMEGDSGRNIEVVATPMENTGVERSAVITIMTMGGTGAPATATVTITQDGAPPTLRLISKNRETLAYDETTETAIMFEVGGGATGWRSSIAYTPSVESGFITLNHSSSGSFGATATGTVAIRVTPMENTGVERTAVITLTTMGGTGVATNIIIITQESAPTIALSTSRDIHIAYNEVSAQLLIFDIGGSATGWIASSDQDFVTLNNERGSLGTGIEVLATPTINNGVSPRTATITISTTGQLGSGKTATVMLTQDGAPASPVLVPLSFTDGDNVSISYDSTTETVIEFVVGGGATGWGVSSSNEDFITIHPSMGAPGQNLSVTATLEGKNTGVERMAVITLSTLGPESTSLPVTATLTIVQSGASPVLSLTSEDRDTLAYDAQTASDITFTLGGGASGWHHEITYGGTSEAFLTLTGDTTMSGEVRVGVASEVNMGMERTATITIKTEGGSGDALDTMITIVQATSPPVLRLISSHREVIAHDRITAKNIIFDVGGGATGWEVSVVENDNNFLTVDRTMGVPGENIAVVARSRGLNAGVERSAVVRIRAMRGVGAVVDTFVTITQMGAVPTLSVGNSGGNIAYNSTESTINFSIGGGATGWRVSSIRSQVADENFITSPEVGEIRNVRGDQRLSITLEENRGLQRLAVITLETVGGTSNAVSADFLILQDAAPPTLRLTSSDSAFISHDVTRLRDITFEVGGGATGWRAEVIEGNDFLTLSKNRGSSGLGRIQVDIRNNLGLSRTGRISIRTVGGAGSALDTVITIRQGSAPPTLTLISSDREDLAYDAKKAGDITFNLGGGATGWSSDITYSEGSEAFITLTGEEDQRGDVRVVVASEVNTGMERTATITIKTEGGLGDALDAMITIVQELVPTISVTTPTEDISIAYDEVSPQTITFEVGGSATGWRVMTDQDFVTLSPMSGDSGRNMEVKVTPTINNGSARTATITFLTTGQLGSSATAEVTLLQGAINITVTTQSEVNGLTTILAGATKIDGNLTIGDVEDSTSSQSDITDLTPLRNITHITGNLTIASNSRLLDLRSLTGLQSIGGSFSVTNNDSLSTLGDFTRLHSIGGALSVTGNDTLESLGNFSVLTHLGTGRVWVPSQDKKVSNTSIVVANNPFLSLCSALEEFLVGGVRAVEGGVYIDNNAVGCNSSQDIQTSFIGHIIVVTQAEVNALRVNLLGKTIINGNLIIGDIYGFSSQNDITDLTPLGNITHITGNLIVAQNEQLVHLTGIHNLATIGGYFVINFNDQLITLGEFPSLTHVGIGTSFVSSLNERKNDVSILVENNPGLSNCCALESFLDRENNKTEGEIYIMNNSTGCDNTDRGSHHVISFLR